MVEAATPFEWLRLIPLLPLLGAAIHGFFLVVLRREAIAGTLVKREGKPQNVADAVAFLLENDFITGVCLPVDGGYCAA